MNINKKYELLQRRFENLMSKNKELENENEALRIKNREFLYRESQYKEQIRATEETRREFLNSISELNKIKEQYRQAIFDARKAQKDYVRKVKPLIRQIKSKT